MCLYLDTYTPSSAYVHFNLKSRLVAMETPTNVPLVGNNGLALLHTIFYGTADLQARLKHFTACSHSCPL